jgi:hypothetical protein
VLVLVAAVPGDLKGERSFALRHQGGDARALPAALRLAAGREGAEQTERLVVVGRNQAARGALFRVTAVAGKTPEPPPRP